MLKIERHECCNIKCLTHPSCSEKKTRLFYNGVAGDVFVKDDTKMVDRVLFFGSEVVQVTDRHLQTHALTFLLSGHSVAVDNEALDEMVTNGFTEGGVPSRTAGSYEERL